MCIVLLRVRVFGSVASLLASLAPAQTVDWRSVPVLEHGQVVHDAVRDRLVLVHPDARTGATVVWEWHADRWVRRASAAAPPARTDFGLAYDAARGRVVMFGGWSTGSTTALGDTWTWDGESWRQHAPSPAPSPRSGASLAYIASSQRVLLFGGGSSSDTWEWDGSTWLQRAASGPVVSGRMAYDVGRDRCVLCGGTATAFATWEWNGTTWWQRSSSGPSRRGGHTVWYDPVRQRVGLFGGVLFPGHPGLTPLNFDDTWEWNGIAWTMLSPPVRPPARFGASAVWDPAAQRVALHGGSFAAPFEVVPHDDTWHWAGGTWTVAEGATRPPWLNTASLGDAVTYDAARDRTVLVRRFQPTSPFETWERDAQRWQQRQPAVVPPTRDNCAVAYDRARARVVLFGGTGGPTGTFADTWEWDGTSWSLRTPPVSPPPRQAHAMTYDWARQRVVMFGGASATGGFPLDTWEWDGATWLLAATVGPPGRQQHAMTYDAARQRVVLCGGRNTTTGWLADVWEWNGAAWLARGTHGGAAAQVAMVYDSLRQVVVLRAAGAVREFDGVAWTPVTTATAGPPGDGVLIYESGAGRTLLESRATGPWVYGLVTAAVAQSAGTGCPGGNGTPVLTSAEPSLGHPAFALELLSAAPGAPCAFWLSDTPQTVAIGPCTLLVGVPLLTSIGVCDARGHARDTQTGIPVAAWLRGLTFHAQAFVLDPLGAVGGIAATQRRTLGIGD